MQFEVCYFFVCWFFLLRTLVETFLLNRIAAYQSGEINAGSAEKKLIAKVCNNRLQEKKAFFVGPAQ